MLALVLTLAIANGAESQKVVDLGAYRHQLGQKAIDRLIEMKPAKREAVLKELSDEEKQALALSLQYDWRRWARPEQLPPDDLGIWDIWVVLAGRSAGKTRTASQQANHWAAHPEEYTNGEQGRLCLVARDAGACRDVMVEGNSGLISSAPPWFMPHYEPSKRRVTWPAVKDHPPVIAEMHSAEEPKTLRGPQFHKGWGDEIASWYRKDPRFPPEAWSDGLDMNVRLGNRPQTMLTGTPIGADFILDICYGPKTGGKRIVTQETIKQSTRVVATTKSGEPITVSRWSFSIENDEGRETTVVSRWSSERNKKNVAAGKIAKLRAKYGGTRAGRQEMDGEILEKVEGALWTEEGLVEARVPAPAKLKRIAVAVDPTRSSDPVDECGIMVGGLGVDGIGYLIEDASVKGPPEVWAAAACEAYNRHVPSGVDGVMIYEKNRIGDKLRETIASVDTSIKWFGVEAMEDKLARAQPISALFAQSKMKHVVGGDDPDRKFDLLEAELTGWDPTSRKSPNRLDAYVWLFTALLLGVKLKPLVGPGSVTKQSNWRQ